MPSKKAAATAKKVSKSTKPSKAVKPTKVAKPAKVTKPTKVAKAAAPVSKNADVEAAKSYKELITEALIALKDRKGSSRPALKKHIKDKYPKVGSSSNFDLHFNNAVKKGVETKDFDQPKGPSGTLKLQKSTSTGNAPPTATMNGSNGNSVSKKPVSSVKKTKPTATTEKKVVKKSSPPSAVPAPTYKEMILEGILQLNQGKGSSRPALKKFVKDQYSSTIKASANFDHLFNNAIKKGVETGDFAQPKGPSGIVKAMKKGKHKTLAQKKTV